MKEVFIMSKYQVSTIQKEELFKEAVKAIDGYNKLVDGYADGKIEEWEQQEEHCRKFMNLFLAEIRSRGLEEEFDDYLLEI